MEEFVVYQTVEDDIATAQLHMRGTPANFIKVAHYIERLLLTKYIKIVTERQSYNIRLSY